MYEQMAFEKMVNSLGPPIELDDQSEMTIGDRRLAPID